MDSPFCVFTSYIRILPIIKLKKRKDITTYILKADIHYTLQISRYYFLQIIIIFLFS